MSDTSNTVTIEIPAPTRAQYLVSALLCAFMMLVLLAGYCAGALVPMPATATVLFFALAGAGLWCAQCAYEMAPEGLPGTTSVLAGSAVALVLVAPAVLLISFALAFYLAAVS